MILESCVKNESSNDTDRKTKTDVIRYALKQRGISDLDSSVMVGDRNHDIEAAVNIGIDSIGVLYGYGSREELTDAGATYIVDTPFDIQGIVGGSVTSGTQIPRR